jgi:hypothetical protein
MARKYEYVSDRVAWCFEKCEELILIAAYEEIRQFIAPDQTWFREFENHFYDHGNGVAVYFIDRINAVRRRRCLDVLDVKETDLLAYGRSPDKLFKSEHRRRVRDEIRRASVDARQNWIERAKTEAAQLLPPHLPYEEWRKARRSGQSSSAQLTRQEIRRREAALSAASAPKSTASKPALDVEKATRMLSLASDPSIRREIISLLSAEHALEVAELVTEPELRNALVSHSFSRVRQSAA